MSSDKEQVTTIAGSVFSRDAIRYGAILWKMSEPDFAGLVVNNFYEQNQAAVAELGDTIINSPKDHLAVLARIESEKASAKK